MTLRLRACPSKPQTRGCDATSTSSRSTDYGLKPGVSLLAGLGAVEAKFAAQQINLVESLSGVGIHLGPAAVHETYEAVDVSGRYENGSQTGFATDLNDGMIEPACGFLDRKSVV